MSGRKHILVQICLMDDEFNRAERKRLDEQKRQKERFENERNKRETLRIAAEAADAAAQEMILKNTVIAAMTEISKPRWELRCELSPGLAADRIILHQSILEELERNGELHFPIILELSKNGKITHAGVLEFSAAEPGLVLVSPKIWMNLSSPITIGAKVVSLGKAKSVQFHAHSSRIFDFPDFRSLLEVRLSKFIALTVGDILIIDEIPITVAAIEPSPAACLLNADVSLDLIVKPNKANEERLGMILDFDVPINWNAPSGIIPLRINLNRKSDITIKLQFEPADAAVEIFAAEPPASEVSPDFFDFVGEPNLENFGTREISIRDASIVFLCVTASGAANVTAEMKPMNIQKADGNGRLENSSQCKNCLKWIPDASFVIHEVRCSRQIYRCQTCSTCINRKFANVHRHCNTCARVVTRQDQHDALWHTPINCLCGVSLPDRNELQRHRKTECRKRLIICRFCGLFEEVGDLSKMDAKDKFEGLLSEHEGLCGNRTETCDFCGKLVRLKDKQLHYNVAHNIT